MVSGQDTNTTIDVFNLIAELTRQGFSMDNIRSALNVPATQTSPVELPLPAPLRPNFSPAQPGWCWLHFVAPHGRERAQALGPDITVERLQAHMQAYPGDYNPGTFSAKLGTKGGLSRGQVRHIDIIETSSEQSRLSAVQLLQALPRGWLIGGEEASPEPVYLPTPGPTTTCVDIRPGPALIDQRAVTFDVTPFSSQRVTAATGPWVHAQARSVQVKFTPRASSRFWFLSVSCCWTRADEGAMTHEEDILSAHVKELHKLAPYGTDTFWPSLTLADPIGRAAIEGTIKPCIPGSCQPVLSVRVTPEWIGEDDPPAGDVAFDVVITTLISISG